LLTENGRKSLSESMKLNMKTVMIATIMLIGLSSLSYAADSTIQWYGTPSANSSIDVGCGESAKNATDNSTSYSCGHWFGTASLKPAVFLNFTNTYTASKIQLYCFRGVANTVTPYITTGDTGTWKQFGETIASVCSPQGNGTIWVNTTGDTFNRIRLSYTASSDATTGLGEIYVNGSLYVAPTPPNNLSLLSPTNNSVATNKYASFAFNFTSASTNKASLFINGLVNQTINVTGNTTNYFNVYFPREVMFNYSINVSNLGGTINTSTQRFTIDDNPWELNGTFVYKPGSTYVVRQCR